LFWFKFGEARGLGFGMALMPSLYFLFGDLGVGFEAKTRVNQAILQSAQGAFTRGVVAGIFGSICFGLSYWLGLHSLVEGIVDAILGLGLSVVALGFGAIPVFQHIALRLVAVRRNLIPLDFEKLLNFCHDIQLLRRVGGTFMFQHKYLRDFYASMPD
jgi:hypothetical protein